MYFTMSNFIQTPSKSGLELSYRNESQFKLQVDKKIRIKKRKNSEYLLYFFGIFDIFK